MRRDGENFLHIFFPKGAFFPCLASTFDADTFRIGLFSREKRVVGVKKVLQRFLAEKSELVRVSGEEVVERNSFFPSFTTPVTPTHLFRDKLVLSPLDGKKEER